jgi:hypothetical protein
LNKETGIGPWSCISSIILRQKEHDENLGNKREEKLIDERVYRKKETYIVVRDCRVDNHGGKSDWSKAFLLKSLRNN